MHVYSHDFELKDCCCKSFHETEYIEFDKNDKQWIIHWEGYDDSIGPDEPISFCPFCGSKITLNVSVE